MHLKSCLFLLIFLLSPKPKLFAQNLNRIITGELTIKDNSYKYGYKMDLNFIGNEVEGQIEWTLLDYDKKSKRNKKRFRRKIGKKSIEFVKGSKSKTGRYYISGERREDPNKIKDLGRYQFNLKNNTLEGIQKYNTSNWYGELNGSVTASTAIAKVEKKEGVQSKDSIKYFIVNESNEDLFIAMAIGTPEKGYSTEGWYFIAANKEMRFKQPLGIDVYIYAKSNGYKYDFFTNETAGNRHWKATTRRFLPRNIYDFSDFKFDKPYDNGNCRTVKFKEITSVYNNLRQRITTKDMERNSAYELKPNAIKTHSQMTYHFSDFKRSTASVAAMEKDSLAEVTISCGENVIKKTKVRKTKITEGVLKNQYRYAINSALYPSAYTKEALGLCLLNEYKDSCKIKKEKKFLRGFESQFTIEVDEYPSKLPYDLIFKNAMGEPSFVFLCYHKENRSVYISHKNGYRLTHFYKKYNAVAYGVTCWYLELYADKAHEHFVEDFLVISEGNDSYRLEFGKSEKHYPLRFISISELKSFIGNDFSTPNFYEKDSRNSFTGNVRELTLLEKAKEEVAASFEAGGGRKISDNISLKEGSWITAYSDSNCTTDSFRKNRFVTVRKRENKEAPFKIVHKWEVTHFKPCNRKAYFSLSRDGIYIAKYTTYESAYDKIRDSELGR